MTQNLIRRGIAVHVEQLTPKGVIVKTMQLPVSFMHAGDAIRRVLREKQPDVVVCWASVTREQA